MKTTQRHIISLCVWMSICALICMTKFHTVQQAQKTRLTQKTSEITSVATLSSHVNETLQQFDKQQTKLSSILNSPFVSIHKSARAYTIKGKQYYPFRSTLSNYSQRGIASWYGPGFHGKKTANGEIYDQNAMTAAHKELPLNSIVRVTNTQTGKSIIVKINDRGPFHGNRIIDLSKAAATELNLIKPGKGHVLIELLPKHYAKNKQNVMN